MSQRPRVSADLAGFPVVIEQQVRWGDMDAFGHVNNTVYLRHFESVRIAYFESMGCVATSAHPSGIAPILASTSCRFRAPLTYPDALRVGARVSSVDSDRFVMEYAVLSVSRDVVAALGDGVVVSYDYGAAGKVELPPEWLAAIERLEG